MLKNEYVLVFARIQMCLSTAYFLGKNSDPDRLNDRDGKDGSESRDRSQKDRRGRGRGFGRGNRRGGGPPRRFG